MGRQKALRILALTLMTSGLVISGKGIWIGGKAVVAQVLLKRAWHKTQLTGRAIKPWPWMDTTPVAELSVPRLNTSTIVLDGASGQALAFGPAHLAATPLPGQPGLSVIAAHKNTQFSFVKNLRAGDIILIRTPRGKVLHYIMSRAEIVDYRDSHIPLAQMPVANEADANALALVTCYPFDMISTGGPLRYVVYAKLTTPVL